MGQTIYQIEEIDIKNQIKELEKTNPKCKTIPILYSSLRRLRETQRNINTKNYWC
jgi:hypothetical protein